MAAGLDSNRLQHGVLSHPVALRRTAILHDDRGFPLPRVDWSCESERLLIKWRVKSDSLDLASTLL
jgi:hypothetical protein